MLQDKIMRICWEMKQYAELQSEFKVTWHLWKSTEKWRSAYKAKMLSQFWEGLSKALEAYDLENPAGWKHTVMTQPHSPMKIWLSPRPWSPVPAPSPIPDPSWPILRLVANLGLILPQPRSPMPVAGPSRLRSLMPVAGWPQPQSPMPVAGPSQPHSPMPVAGPS